MEKKERTLKFKKCHSEVVYRIIEKILLKREVGYYILALDLRQLSALHSGSLSNFKFLSYTTSPVLI